MQRPNQEQYDELVRITRMMRQVQTQNASTRKKSASMTATMEYMEKKVDALLSQFPDLAQPAQAIQGSLFYESSPD